MVLDDVVCGVDVVVVFGMVFYVDVFGYCDLYVVDVVVVLDWFV